MLKEIQLFETIDRVQKSIDRLKEFEPNAIQNNPEGYYVCISGGKDSSTIQQLCILAKVRCAFYHHLTTVDAPETIRFVRAEGERMKALGYKFEITIPRYLDGRPKTMWNLIEKKGYPTRKKRWCCDHFKEHEGKDRFCVLGVRWAESLKRKKTRGLYEFQQTKRQGRLKINNDDGAERRLLEVCNMKRQIILNPIVDWENSDVWDFLRQQGVPTHPLYSKEYTRVGCVGCPISMRKDRYMLLQPHFKQAYIKAGGKHLQLLEEKKAKTPDMWDTPEHYFEWWRSEKWENQDPTLDFDDDYGDE